MMVILATAAVEARAQYYPGYGTFGWGGWGGAATPQGSIARGLGYFEEGLGELDKDAAVTTAINEKTVQDWNQYMWLSQQQANQRAQLRRMRRAQRDAQSGDVAVNRLRTNPTRDDIEDGAALNIVLDDLTDPRIQGSALRLATSPLAGDAIRQIPFQSGSEAVAISLGQLAAQGQLPTALRGEKYGPERLEYQQAIDQALQESESGKITPATLQRVDRALSALYTRFRANPPANRAEQVEAENYLRTLFGMARLLKQPQVEKVLGELEKTPRTTLGNLLGFMNTYNLRFGEATTPAQRAIYQQLYPPLVALRDQVVKEAGLGTPPASTGDNRNRPADFFQGMNLEHLSGKPADNR